MGYSRHFTVIFHTFVLMQIFNLFNARKLRNEFNIFAGVLRNATFIIIVALIFLLQAIFMTYGRRVFSVFRDGMNGPQWGIAFAFGFGEWVVGALSKLVPEGSKGSKTKPLENLSGDKISIIPHIELS